MKSAIKFFAIWLLIAVPLLLVADVKNKSTIKTDATANLADNTSMFLQPVIDIVDSVDLSFANITALQAGGANLSEGTIANLESYTLPGDNGGGRVWLDIPETGTHTGANNQAVMTDSAATFSVNELVGLIITNTTDASSTATVTSNTATTVTGQLTGGTEADWDTNDAYNIKLGAGVENAGDVIASAGGTDWYWRRVLEGGIGDYDIRKWGGVVSIIAGDSTVNDTAFTNMIASTIPSIYLPGPIVISATIDCGRQISIYGTNPWNSDGGSTESGGLIVTGSGTAKTNAVLHLYDAQNCLVEGVRFYGHLLGSDTVVSTNLPVLAIQVSQEVTADIKADAVQSNLVIRRCVFRPFDLTNIKETSFATCIKFGDSFTGTALDQQTDDWLIENCYFHKFTTAAIHIENSQAISGRVQSSTINGGQVSYYAMPTQGVLSKASYTIADTTINRCQVALQHNGSTIDRVHGLHIENCRQFIRHSATAGKSVDIRNSQFIFQNAGQTEGFGAHDGTNNQATVLTDSGEGWTTSVFVGDIIFNTTDNSSGAVTANTTTTITCSAGLSGGTDNDWDTTDAYTIVDQGVKTFIRSLATRFSLTNCAFPNQLTVATNLPRLRLGGTAADIITNIRISDVQGIGLNDIKSVSVKGSPAQLDKRLDVNSGGGVQFEWYGASGSDILSVVRAEQDDGGVFTDETINTNSSADGDVDCFPTTSVVNDAFYIGLNNPIARLTIDRVGGTQGVGGAVAYEYSQGGAAWGTLAGVVDETAASGVFGNAALSDSNVLEFERPSDWDTDEVDGDLELYWIRLRVTTGYTTEPILSQVKVGGTKPITLAKYIPSGIENLDNTYQGGSDCSPGTNTVIDSSGGGGTLTVPDDSVIGRQTRVYMSDATTSTTLSITNHVTSDPETYTFDDVNDYVVLEWTADGEYRTVENTAVAP